MAQFFASPVGTTFGTFERFIFAPQVVRFIRFLLHIGFFDSLGNLLLSRNGHTIPILYMFFPKASWLGAMTTTNENQGCSFLQVLTKAERLTPEALVSAHVSSITRQDRQTLFPKSHPQHVESRRRLLQSK